MQSDQEQARKQEEEKKVKGTGDLAAPLEEEIDQQQKKGRL